MALTFKDVRRLFQVPPQGRVRLRDYDPGWAARKEFEDLKKTELKARALDFMQNNVAELADAQERLYASDTHSVLIVLQAMDAAGKDGTIKHVMSGVNPQGCQVFSFKKPSSEELDHNFLWRYTKALPERGRIGIFNRSYYEDVLVVRVHPEYSEPSAARKGSRQQVLGWPLRRHQPLRAPPGPQRHARSSSSSSTSRRRSSASDSWSGSRSRKRTGSSPSAISKSASTGTAYQEAFENMLQHTSTEWAPWWVIPADNKWVTRVLVASVITNSIKRLGLKFPEVTDEQRKRFAAAKKELTRG